jgi:hypothetical protein
MAKRDRQRPLPEHQTSPHAIEARDYFADLRFKITSNLLFVDASAILDCHDPAYRDKMVAFLEEEAIRFKLFTTTHVVAEVARRLIHPVARYNFRGPNNEQYRPLANYVINQWLQDYKVAVIAVPECVFELAKANLADPNTLKKKELTGWSLTDAISYIIVKGMGLNQILAKDDEFEKMGLLKLPS